MRESSGAWDGRIYDRMRRADPALADLLHRHLAPAAGDVCLDLACGTGNYTIALARRGVAMVGVDAAGGMLRTARAKASELRWVCADAARLPFAGQTFGGILCTLAIHHFGDLEAAFGEVARVQRGGRLVLFTAWPEQTRDYWLNHYFPRAIARSARQLPGRRVVQATLEVAGLGVTHELPWRVPWDLIDLFLYAGKHRPGLYLDPDVRAGISTFAGLAEPRELAAGLARLETDIASGRIDEVIAAHSGPAGDYVLLVAEPRGGR